MPTSHVLTRSRCRSRALLAALALASSLASPTLVRAEPLDDASRAAALTLAESGFDAYDAGRYDEASEALDKAYVVARIPPIGLWSARALEKRGLWLEAAERFKDTADLPLVADAPPAYQEAQVAARAELADLQTRLPNIVIELEGATAAQVRFSLDGKPLTAATHELKFPANPGLHKLEAQLGTATQVRDVNLEAGKTERVVIEFDSSTAAAAAVTNDPMAVNADPTDAEPSAAWPLRTWGWISVGAGAAGLAVGTIGLASALSKKSDIEDGGLCVGGECPSSKASDIDSYDSWKTISTIGFVAGGLLAATGVTLILIDTPQGSTEAFIGPGTIGARGHF
jgi:hypothetical protein